LQLPTEIEAGSDSQGAGNRHIEANAEKLSVSWKRLNPSGSTVERPARLKKLPVNASDPPSV